MWERVLLALSSGITLGRLVEWEMEPKSAVCKTNALPSVLLLHLSFLKVAFRNHIGLPGLQIWVDPWRDDQYCWICHSKDVLCRCQKWRKGRRKEGRALTPALTHPHTPFLGTTPSAHSLLLIGWEEGKTWGSCNFLYEPYSSVCLSLRPRQTSPCVSQIVVADQFPVTVSSFLKHWLWHFPGQLQGSVPWECGWKASGREDFCRTTCFSKTLSQGTRSEDQQSLTTPWLPHIENKIWILFDPLGRVHLVYTYPPLTRFSKIFMWAITRIMHLVIIAKFISRFFFLEPVWLS